MGYTDLVLNNLLPGVTLDSPPLVNISGCPPMAEVITDTIAHFLVYVLPELDSTQSSSRTPIPLRRPKIYYGTSVHSTCPRYGHFLANEFAASFGDEKAKQGWCLLHLGYRGPEASNACIKLGWNKDPTDNPAKILKNSPTHTGHGCIGCSEPNFWDTGLNGRFSQGFYTIQQ